MRRNGFTLMELVAAIAIIALLTMILAPSILSAKRTARRVLCASNLHHIGTAISSAVGSLGPGGKITRRQYPVPDEWPLIPYRMMPTQKLFICPEDVKQDWEATIPGLVYHSMWDSPPLRIPFKKGPFCDVRRGEDAYGKYWEFVVEENTGYYVGQGIRTSGAHFSEDQPWFAEHPYDPDYSNNDGLFRLYDSKDGARRFKLQYCTCTLPNELYYYNKLIWDPMRTHVGSDIYFSDVYTSYGMNSALPKTGAAADTIVTLDYPVRIAQFSDTMLDKQQIAAELEDVSSRHVKRVNVLFADKSVRTLGLSEANPTMNPDPWTP